LTLQDTIREQTWEIVDALTLADRRRKDLISSKDAAEDAIKRAYTEITRHRALESERKRLVVEAEERLKEVQDRFEEINRQRQEILDRLTEKQETKEQAEKLLRESRSETERALGVVRTETERRDKGIGLLAEIEGEKLQYEGKLREAHRRSVDIYIQELERRVEQAFAGEEERSRRQTAAEAFRKARHDDNYIGDLCDQRDQFRELVRLATVPGVAETLRRELERVERELDKRYPGALSIEEKVPSQMLVEELHYLIGSDELLRIVLPIPERVWNGISRGETGAEATGAMRMVWEMIIGLGLKPSDGEFRFENGYCVFVARELKDDDMNSIREFTLKLKSSATLTFRFSPFPSQVQEALLYEATR
jgi:gas vesicle protein